MDKTKAHSWLGNLTLSQFYIGTKVAFGCELISYFRLIPTLAPRQKYGPLCLRSHAGLLSLWCCSNLDYICSLYICCTFNGVINSREAELTSFNFKTQCMCIIFLLQHIATYTFSPHDLSFDLMLFYVRFSHEHSYIPLVFARLRVN